MGPDRDIYNAPGGEGKDDRNLPLVGAPLAEERARTRRHTVIFSTLMVVILVIAWVVVYHQEQQEEEAERLAEVAELQATDEGMTPGPSGITYARPQLPDLTENLTRPVGATLDDLDRDRLSKAISEVRVANEYLLQQDWDGAETHARRALDIWPDMNAGLRLMGFVYTQRGQFDQAAAILEKALQQEPFSAETFNNLASAYMQKWELERAESLLNTALDLRPDFAVAHMNLGLLYIILGRYPLTIDHLEQALELAPESVSARNNLAVALLRVGRYEEAREHLQNIINRFPARASAYFNMAITYVLERNFGEAMGYIQLGATHCSPVACRNFLADSDFDPMRGHPAFQSFINNLYPELPQFPES